MVGRKKEKNQKSSTGIQIYNESKDNFRFLLGVFFTLIREHVGRVDFRVTTETLCQIRKPEEEFSKEANEVAWCWGKIRLVER